jgi:hypothetical protein
MLLNLKKDNQIHKTQDRFKTSLSQRTLVESDFSQPVKGYKLLTYASQ